MRRNLSIRASSILLLLLAASPPLAAAEAIVDQITIKDGSILKGEIKRVENDELILDTDYADDVVIDVEHIVKIKSKQQFSIRLISGEIISGFLAVSKGKIVLRENLSAPGETKEAEEPGEIDFKESEGEAPPITPIPEVGEIVQKASPTAESQLQQTTPDDLPREEAMSEVAKPDDVQQTTPDDLPRDEATSEIAKPADDWLSDAPTAVERPGGRQFSFDDVDWIREKPTYLRYDAELNVGAQSARGNTDTTDLHFDARFEPSFGWNTFRLSGLLRQEGRPTETRRRTAGRLLSSTNGTSAAVGTSAQPTPTNRMRSENWTSDSSSLPVSVTASTITTPPTSAFYRLSRM